MNAVETFEKLTYCTQWKILMARVEATADVDSRLVPCVKLVDTNTEVVIVVFYFFFLEKHDEM